MSVIDLSGSYCGWRPVKIPLTSARTVIFVILFVLISVQSFGQGNETEKEWIQSFKELVYYNGLLKGLNNPALSKELVQTDNSFTIRFHAVGGQW
ncbi:hypothetical protein DRW42_00010 [Pedobacter miscanthi]|uniref:Uncharacterized protein n=1 Tax=Pedobacter miscanthi TaxID=2259170 RepID=A0A366LEX9_9SPHI|nr:hypothetical protein DRW42_00010 [Pedobacter miscanthi]